MNGRNHFIGYAIAVIVMIPIYVYYHNFAYLILAIVSYAIVNPDVDHAMFPALHRSAYTHSILLPFLIYTSFPPGTPIAVFYTLCIPMSVHLLLDLYAHGERRGKWLIHFTRRRQLPPIWSSLWLVANATLPLFLWLSLR